MAKRKPTVGERQVLRYFGTMNLETLRTHPMYKPRRILARRIDHAVRQAFKDGIDCNFYEHSPRIQSKGKADKLRAKYRIKAAPTTRNNEERDE